jgi:hypothetical protein
MKIRTLWAVALLLPLASPVALATNLPDLPVGGCYHASKAIPNGGIIKNEFTTGGRASFQQCRDGVFGLPFTLADLPA